MEQEKKNKLISALEEEKAKFKLRGQSTLEHSLAIRYLTTGVKPYDESLLELLLVESAINDIETLYSDYCE